MATGGSEESKLLSDRCSDISHEYACTLCIQKKGSYSEATHYCPDCDVYYCRPCLQYSCDHGSLGKAKVDRWAKPTCHKPGEACTEHRGNMIQLYCGEHNTVGCHVCMADKHQFCTQMMCIYQLVSKQDIRRHLNEMQREIREMQSRISKIRTVTILRKETLETTYNDLKKEMRDFRQMIIGLLDDLEKQSVNELNEMMKTISDQIDEESQTCNRLHKDIDSIEHKLQKSNVDDTLLFIWLNQSNNNLEGGGKVLSELEKTATSELPSFKVHSEIESSMRNLVGIGKLLCPGFIKANKVNMPYYPLQKTNSFSVLDEMDTQPCQILGMCQLPNGSFVICDWNNSCLKQMNSSYEVKIRYSVSIRPNSVCCTGDQEVAVALDNSTIQFVSVGATMNATRAITLKHECTGLAYKNDKLYVTSVDPTVYVYSMAGTCQRQISLNEYFSLFLVLYCLPHKRSITVSPDGNSIHVTSPNRNILLTIDNESKLVSTFRPRKTKYVRDVCVDDVGNVFVCGRDSNDIIQVESTGGRKSADIVLPSDGIKSPLTICFDKINSRLLVACLESDEVHSLDLVQ